MAAPARLLVLALLLVATAAAVAIGSRQEVAGTPGYRPEAGAAGTALLWLMALAMPLLAAILLAAVHHRVTRRRATDRHHGTPVLRGLLGALGLLGLLAALAAVIPLRAPDVSLPSDQDGRAPDDRQEPPGRDAGNEPATADPAPGGEAGPSGLLDVVTVFVVAAVLLLALAALIAHWPRRAPGGPVVERGHGEQGHGSRLSTHHALVEATRRALSEVDSAGQSPREAIIRSYATFERALADAPDAAPHPADTASDVLGRAVHAGKLRAEHGGRLVELFAEARFSTHPMTEQDRADAADTLRRALDDLRERVWSPS
ncbi:DUF4129 domain-containing protein [Haloechinothrix sp. LS1_15]|nr:DUF4129 domain-containing protein [Haloechinothrix sp. LS1_15]